MIFQILIVSIINVDFSNRLIYLFEIGERDRQAITNAMQKLAYDVAIRIVDSEDRKACVQFRPREDTDENYLLIEYGNGCSASVSTCRAPHFCVKIVKELISNN